MTKPRDLKKRFMADPEFRQEYARADDEFALIEALVRARAAAKLTQSDRHAADGGPGADG